MSAPTIMVTEDDDALRDVLVRGLREEGFGVTAASTATQAIAHADRHTFAGLVIDIGLPDADGRDLCQALRARGVRAPVLFLTARDALPDRLSGFAAGGDDYVCKPFAFDELVVRLEALLRRGGEAPARVGGMVVDPATHSAACGDVSIALTPTEFRLLALLAAHAGETVRRKQLVQAGWPSGAIVHDNTLDAYVARLRRKLRALPDAPTLSTVYGVGYVMQ